MAIMLRTVGNQKDQVMTHDKTHPSISGVTAESFAQRVRQRAEGHDDVQLTAAEMQSLPSPPAASSAAVHFAQDVRSRVEGDSGVQLTADDDRSGFGQKMLPNSEAARFASRVRARVEGNMPGEDPTR
jgi:hypothetical protein